MGGAFEDGGGLIFSFSPSRVISREADNFYLSFSASL